MTTTELCASAGLTSRELQNWIENGLLEPAGMVGRSAGGGVRREFTGDQAERARVLKALHSEIPTCCSHFTVPDTRACIRLHSCARMSLSLAAMRLPIVFRWIVNLPVW